MANNPVQIVLNDSDYITPPEAGRGGPPHDFFPDRDDEFKKHKAKLAIQIAKTAEKLAASGADGVGYIKVKLRPDALAKSHRPIREMLIPDRFPSVGAAGLGELFYLASAADVASLLGSVASAETYTNWVENADGKMVARPSVAKSEVGAIAELVIPEPESKRNFDAKAATEWLAQPGTGGTYIVELFENPRSAEIKDGKSRVELIRSLDDLLQDLGTGIVAWRMPEAGGEVPLALRIEATEAPPRLSAAKIPGDVPDRISMDAIRHEEVLQRLAQHPAVRRISLPLKLELSAHGGVPSGAASVFPVPAPGVRYPKVGIIDDGLGPALAAWTLGRHDFLDEAEVNADHGSFVGGLVVGAAAMNPSLGGLEPDGCELVDLALFPSSDFATHYPRGFADFLEEMDQAIGEAKRTHKVRIFNLSINAVSPVESDQYSYYAARIDQISEKHDVIIVNSAGNLTWKDRRSPWPQRTAEALKYFAARTEPDTIYKPSESFRAVSVGAINPAGCSVHHHGLPTTFSRRGPGLKVGTKPDVAHYGGNDGTGPAGNHGLISLKPGGAQVSDCGTSFSAPLVTKSLSVIEDRIEGYLPAHTLRALLLHNCSWPDALADKRLAQLARQFVGFGIPCPTSEMLTTDDSAITLVFNSRLPDDAKRPKVLRFDFQWPQSLVDPATGACRGEARATLVYEPPVDRAYGAEFVRINLDAKLQQRQSNNRKDGSPSYRDRFTQGFLPKTAGEAASERELISQGLKWWPTKRYVSKIPDSNSNQSSEWRIEVASIRRAEALFPKEGVPFTLIVTIRDPDGTRPIFPQLRRALQSQQVQLHELRTHQRIRT